MHHVEPSIWRRRAGSDSYRNEHGVESESDDCALRIAILLYSSKFTFTLSSNSIVSAYIQG